MSGKFPLSVRVLGTVIEAWKVGRAALALLVIGAIAILAAFGIVLKQPDLAFVALSFLAVGCVFVGIVAYAFCVEAVVPIKKTTKIMRENAELMDAVQDATIELTIIISQFNDYALTHANEIVSKIDAAKKLMDILPGGDRILKADYFTRSDAFARKIRTVANQSRSIVLDIQDSVNKSDASRIISHVKSLRSVKTLIESELLAGKNV